MLRWLSSEIPKQCTGTCRCLAGGPSPRVPNTRRNDDHNRTPKKGNSPSTPPLKKPKPARKTATPRDTRSAQHQAGGTIAPYTLVLLRIIVIGLNLSKALPEADELGGSAQGHDARRKEASPKNPAGVVYKFGRKNPPKLYATPAGHRDRKSVV